jgi:dienelactone hydrolase
MVLNEFNTFPFTHDGATRTVYRRGQGPGVVVMHEIPGITPPVADFATRLKERASEGCAVLGLRFTGDPMCPGERFATLRRELGPAFEGIEIDSSRGNPHGIKRIAHSVVTNDLVDREGHPTRVALDRVLGFFRERLLEA